jgi:hypothetical protein
MAKPTSRTEMKEYCLRKLGSPVIQINVADSQVEDRIDEALEFFQEIHYDAVKRDYVKHQVTQDDIDNGYLPLTNDITTTVRILKITESTSSSSLFDVRYQLHLNDIFDFTTPTAELGYYSTVMQNVTMLDDMLNSLPQMRYTRHEDRLYIDMDWSAEVAVGDYIVIECYRMIDGDTFPQLWDDKFLKEYATAKIKLQWGSNISKYQGIELPGGVTLDGKSIYQEALEEIAKLEEEARLKYELPVDFITG